MAVNDGPEGLKLPRSEVDGARTRAGFVHAHYLKPGMEVTGLEAAQSRLSKCFLGFAPRVCEKIVAYR